MRRLGRRRATTALAATGLTLLVACCPAALAAQVYVTNGNTPGVVAQFGAAADGRLAPLSAATAATGADPLGMALSPDGQRAYVANSNASSISQFAVAADGTLAPLTPATAAAGVRPAVIAVSPTAGAVYVTNIVGASSPGTVSQLSIGPGGTLTAMTPPTVDTANNPQGIAVTPDGQHVYVANFGSASVSQYAVGAGGALSAMVPATVATGTNPQGIAVSPDGQRVYVAASGGGGSVSQYAVGAGGTLSPLTPATVTVPNARGVAISPNGANVYIGAVPNVVYQFTVGAGGLLSPKSPPSVGAGGTQFDSLAAIAVSADGTSVYAASNNGALSQFSIGAGGTLSAKTPLAAATGLGFASGGSLAVSPLPPATAPSLSVQASGSVGLGGSVSASATLSGAAGASGTITFRVYGPSDPTCQADPLATSSAAVSGNGSYVSAPFTPSTPGTYRFTASYGGDATHAAVAATACSDPAASVTVSAFAAVLVTNPASGVTQTSATLSGTVNPGGGATTYVFEYGPSLSFGSITTPTSVGSGTSPVAVSASITGLPDATRIYYRLVATNAVATTFGAAGAFNTGFGGAPVVTTGAPALATTTTASVAGQVNPNGHQTAATFEYGTSQAFGAITAVVALDDAQAVEPVSAGLSGLQPDTTYYVRVVATNSSGTSTGAVRSFNTGPGGVPGVATGSPSGVTSSSATLAGTVDAHGLATSFTFAFGTSATNLGSITAVDSAGSGFGAQAVSLPASGLQPATTYVYRLVATNTAGTSLGVLRSFTTSPAS